MQPFFRLVLFAYALVIHYAAGQDDWRSGQDGSVPCNAFVGTLDKGKPVYVARAALNGGLLPGKLVSRLGQAYIPFNDKEYKVSSYDVLCNSRSYSWEFFSISVQRSPVPFPASLFFNSDPPPVRVPSNAVVGGYSAVHKDNLYICKVGSSIGKVHLRHKACFYPYGGKEGNSKIFDLLVRD
ncbi:uncharacterized protein LOC132203930 [Neocloeon triangulifer]|uniref:uncharacterized protein LOC132203930 n=1 Tax=Neocloeon triangulifer TaxID=2078957 RepID=UPI00286F75DC|nr:uncharacterized protein LOC132203930 [Neocloeon triangulifer]